MILYYDFLLFHSISSCVTPVEQAISVVCVVWLMFSFLDAATIVMISWPYVMSCLMSGCMSWWRIEWKALLFSESGQFLDPCWMEDWIEKLFCSMGKRVSGCVSGGRMDWKLLCSLSQKSVWIEVKCYKQICPLESDLPRPSAEVRLNFVAAALFKVGKKHGGWRNWDLSFKGGFWVSSWWIPSDYWGVPPDSQCFSARFVPLWIGSSQDFFYIRPGLSHQCYEVVWQFLLLLPLHSH